MSDVTLTTSEPSPQEVATLEIAARLVESGTKRPDIMAHLMADGFNPSEASTACNWIEAGDHYWRVDNRHASTATLTPKFQREGTVSASESETFRRLCGEGRKLLEQGSTKADVVAALVEQGATDEQAEAIVKDGINAKKVHRVRTVDHEQIRKKKVFRAMLGFSCCVSALAIALGSVILIIALIAKLSAIAKINTDIQHLERGF